MFLLILRKKELLFFSKVLFKTLTTLQPINTSTEQMQGRPPSHLSTSSQFFLRGLQYELMIEQMKMIKNINYITGKKIILLY